MFVCIHVCSRIALIKNTFIRYLCFIAVDFIHSCHHCLKMSSFSLEKINQYNGPKPELYRRYIDDCIGATSSSREDLNQFIIAVNSFHPALRYTWEISDTSLAFLDIKVSIEGNGLCTSVYYKPTDSHSYLLYSSSHPSHVKNSIPYSHASSLDFVVFVVTTLIFH